MSNRDLPRHDPTAYLEQFGLADALGRLLGHRLVAISPERCESEYQARPEHWNPNGILHGGALFSAMDSAQGAFIHFILEPRWAFAATGTATVRFHRPVKRERLTLITTLVRTERRKLYLRTEALLPEGTLVAELDEIWIAIADPP